MAVMITSTRSLFSNRGLPLFLLTCRSFASMPAAAPNFLDSDIDDTHSANQNRLKENVDSMPNYLPFTVRLHLIRHGETLANERNIVLGQGDSPLTDKGLALAGITAQSGFINGRTDAIRYWRTYTSDLYRAHRTAKIVLGIEDIHTKTRHVGQQETSTDETVDDIDLIVDDRLRELAKGPREGYLKTLSFEEAMSRRLQQAIKDNKNQLEQKLVVPKLESIADAWNRATDWVGSLVKDALDDYYSMTSSRKVEDIIDSSCNTFDSEPKKIYDVFALSHSALIRTCVHKMVGSQLPEDYALTNEGSLLLPNLSRTVIDVRPYYSKLKRSGSSQGKNNDTNDEMTLRWRYKLVHLADVSHLSDDPKINSERPTYL